MPDPLTIFVLPPLHGPKFIATQLISYSSSHHHGNMIFFFHYWDLWRGLRAQWLAVGQEWLVHTYYRIVGNFCGYKFSWNGPKFGFQKLKKCLESLTTRNGNLSSSFQYSEESTLVPRTFVVTIASALGLALSGLCVCVYVAFRFPG